MMLFSSCSIVSEDNAYHTYEFTGRHDFLEDFFALNMQAQSSDSYVDRLHQLNPDVFVLTNLTEPVWDRANKRYCIKSLKTEKVYECKVKKGTKIRTGSIRN
jgi:hypothetical protein